MSFLNIAGYKFVPLTELDALRQELLLLAKTNSIKGTILLSAEGINLNLAGVEVDVQRFIEALKGQALLNDLRFHRTTSEKLPFQYLKVRIKPEIITLREPAGNPAPGSRAPSISPFELKQWLDEKRDLTLLDTRNDYEVRFGTFTGAVNLSVQHFGELPQAIHALDRHKPVVMFCTGGIRCEKAGLLMQSQGFEQVYQLDGGILGYFKEVGGAHYQGECFIFDERIALDVHLNESGTRQCIHCQGPLASQLVCKVCFPLEKAV